MQMETKHIILPIATLPELQVGDCVLVSGKVLCGRDAVLPKICSLIENGLPQMIDADFNGSAIFHTAVSNAGIGPTSSNKLEIEESFEPLCRAGVRVFLGKGEISRFTDEVLSRHGSCFAVVPPVSALLSKGMISKRLVAFPELGMEALYEVELKECPAVIASVNGKSLFEKRKSHGA